MDIALKKLRYYTLETEIFTPLVRVVNINLKGTGNECDRAIFSGLDRVAILVIETHCIRYP